MGAFVLRKLASVFLAILVAAAVSGCSGVPRAAQSSTPLSSAAAGPVSSLPRGSEVPFSSEPESSSAPQQDGEASVSGRDNHFELGNLEFLNDQTGWVIENRYQDDNRVSSQLLATKDGGTTWDPAGDDGRTLSAVRFVSESEGWAIAEDDGGAAIVTADTKKQYQVLHTSDGGASWKIQWQGGFQPNSKPALYFPGKKNGYALLGDSLLKTENGGETWTAVSFGVRNFTPVRIYFSNSGTGWAAGVSTKKDTLSVLRTYDGGKNWTDQFKKNFDQDSAGCIAINFLSEKEGWFLTSDLGSWNGGLYHTVDGGDHWSLSGTVRCFRPYAEDLCFTDSKTGWIPFSPGAGPIDGGLSYTRDGGKTFQILGKTDAEGAGPRSITGANQVLFLSAQNGWAVGEDPNHGDYLLSTRDGGNTWEQRYPNPGPVKGFSFVSGETGFGLGELSDENALLETQDGGESWQEITNFTGSYSSYGQSAYFRFFDAKNGVAVHVETKWQVFRTRDGGKTWSLSSGSFSNGTLPDQAELGRLSGDTAQWNYPPAAMGTGGGLAAALLPDGKGMVLTDTPSGRYELLTTADRGNTWSRRLLPESLGKDSFDSVMGFCPMQFTDDGHGWLLTGHGMLVTKDGGVSWKWQK